MLWWQKLHKYHKEKKILKYSLRCWSCFCLESLFSLDLKPKLAMFTLNYTSFWISMGLSVGLPMISTVQSSSVWILLYFNQKCSPSEWCFLGMQPRNASCVQQKSMQNSLRLQRLLEFVGTLCKDGSQPWSILVLHEVSHGLWDVMCYPQAVLRLCLKDFLLVQTAAVKENTPAVKQEGW